MQFKHYLEALALKGDYKRGVFQQLVAAFYEMAPQVEERAIPAFKELEAKVVRQHQMLQSKYSFKPTNDDPYKSVKDLSRQINQQRTQGIKKPEMRVYTGGEQHPVFSQDTNVMLRGVHDAIAHLAGMHAFSARGEFGAYNRHLKTVGPKAAPALFTEIIGQTSYYYIYSRYTTQKAILLPDFDYFNVGALSAQSGLNSFFVLQNKELIPSPHFSAQTFQQNFPNLYSVLIQQPITFLKS